MLFSRPISMANLHRGHPVQDKTSPNAVVFGGKLYLFYTGTDEGIWSTSTVDGRAWTLAQGIKKKIRGIGVEDGTSSNAAVFGNTLYLFYTGIGEDGIWYTHTTDGESWKPVRSVAQLSKGMEVLEGTSASGVVFCGRLYLFYSGSDDEGIWYTYTRDGQNWSRVTGIKQKINGMGVQEGTSPNAVVLNDSLFLFYTGIGGDGIWYTTTTDGDHWSPVRSIAKLANGMSVLEGSSAAAVELNGRLYLFYSRDDDEGLGYTTTTDGLSWTRTRSVKKDLISGPQGVEEGSSPWAVEFNSLPYVFWHGVANDSISYCTEAVFDIHKDFDTIIDHIQARHEFAVAISDADTVADLKRALTHVQETNPEQLTTGNSAVAELGRASKTRRVLMMIQGGPVARRGQVGAVFIDPYVLFYALLGLTTVISISIIAFQSMVNTAIYKGYSWNMSFASNGTNVTLEFRAPDHDL